ncbi:putative MutT/NUDIX-family protein [Marmoricola endophyticus]|uniref:MutT/NUDIX-family protein n=1 Tax=Marmoricola endophyticus TaxID=2040280 RepID=A0A917BQ85_9ACTN|nr:NUDIX domain-containing protein [Marmoricola endophyticus]GGF52610.1 putative MutT/NUDIX-family protein [Marmoricola endophyticus]
MPIPPYVADLRRHVEHTELWLPGTTAVVLDDDTEPTRVLLVRRSDNGAWTPVTGIVDPGEHPAVTAVREAAEEACVEIRVVGLVAVGVVDEVTYDNGDRARYLDHTFRCVWVSGEPAVGDDESSEVRWWPLDDLTALAPRMRERIERALAWDGTTALVTDGFV